MESVRARVRDLLGEERWQQFCRVGGWLTRSYTVVILLGVVIGLGVAPVATDLAGDPVRGTVAVVTLEGSIDGGNAASVAARLERARTDPSIDAVVLRVNSGGGGAPSSEEIYLQVAKTAKQMPVVASVGSISASGAYYASVASDYVFAKPASLVGNVGVVFVLPQEIGPTDRVVTTGPNKLTGADRRDWYYKTEAIQNAFVGAVVEQRGDALDLSAQQVAYGKLYTGGEAVKHGLADETGGLDAAIAKAATMAGLHDWDAKLLEYEGTVSFLTRSAYSASAADRKELVSPAAIVAPPAKAAAPNIVMVPRSVVRAGLEDARERGGSGTAVILESSTRPGADGTASGGVNANVTAPAE